MTNERMTNEEAIRMLKAKLACLSMDTSGCYSERNEELCDECPLNYEQGNMGEQKEYIRMSIEALERKPCEDAISRQAVDDAIYDYSRSCDVNYQQIMEFIEKIPSVTPQPRIGTWIKNEWGNISCSSCGCTALYDKVYLGESVFGKAIRVKSTFCPTCGAKMEEVEE